MSILGGSDIERIKEPLNKSEFTLDELIATKLICKGFAGTRFEIIAINGVFEPVEVLITESSKFTGNAPNVRYEILALPYGSYNVHVYYEENHLILTMNLNTLGAIYSTAYSFDTTIFESEIAGDYTVQVPEGYSEVYITACGGGGGGARGTSGSSTNGGNGGQGGSGAPFVRDVAKPISASTITVKVGAGGAGESESGGGRGYGTATVVSVYGTLSGGSWGGSSGGGGTGGAGGNGGINGGSGKASTVTDGEGGTSGGTGVGLNNGGSYGPKGYATVNGSYGYPGGGGGGGGGGSLGRGGAGGRGFDGGNTSTTFSGGNGVLGGGGGGAGGSGGTGGSSSRYEKGGNGGNGYVKLVVKTKVL